MIRIKELRNLTASFGDPLACWIKWKNNACPEGEPAHTYVLWGKKITNEVYAFIVDEHLFIAGTVTGGYIPSINKILTQAPPTYAPWWTTGSFDALVMITEPVALYAYTADYGYGSRYVGIREDSFYEAYEKAYAIEWFEDVLYISGLKKKRL